MNLRVRVVRCTCAGYRHWYADIDDSNDPQPDDPYWFADRCPTQAAALELACAKLLELSAEEDSLARVQEAQLVSV